MSEAKVHGGGLGWHIGQGLSKNQWLEAEPKDGLPARIKQLDAQTFACYRGGKYLGCEPTLQEAFDRVKSNAISEKNRVMAIWQRQHPDELPPGLQLTDAERAEYWRHNPIAKPAAARSTSKPSPPTGGHKRNEVAVPPRAAAKEQPSASVPPRAAATHQAASKAASKKAEPSKAKEPSAPRGNARVDKAAIAKMLERGCTSEEVLKFTGWKAISMPAMAKSIGVGLRIDKSRKPFRYFSEKKGGK